jgi:hypothetical protein
MAISDKEKFDGYMAAMHIRDPPATMENLASIKLEPNETTIPKDPDPTSTGQSGGCNQCGKCDWLTVISIAALLTAMIVFLVTRPRRKSPVK